MSDDTPTRRFGPQDDEPPTERLGAQPPAEPPVTEPFDAQADLDADDEPDGLDQLFGGSSEPTGPTPQPTTRQPSTESDPLAWLTPTPNGAAGSTEPGTIVFPAAGAAAGGVAAGAAAGAAAARPGAEATTMRFDQLPPLPSTGGGFDEEPPTGGGPGRGVIIGLAIAGGVLLIAIVVLLVVILGGGSGADEADGDGEPTSSTPRPSTSSGTPTPEPSETTPTPEPTTETPTPTPTATTPPVATAPTIVSFKASPTEAACPSESNDDVIPITLTWDVKNATSISVAVDGETLPGSDASGFSAPFRCGSGSHKYTLQTSNGSANTAVKDVSVTRTVTAPPEGETEG